MPEQFLGQVQAWIRVLQGLGCRPSLPRPWKTIRCYLGYALPSLQDWGQRYDSLRAVTTGDVEAAIDGHTGNSPHNVHTGLRSLFRALKRERLIFHDPARSVTRHFARRLPRPLPTDRLHGLLDRLANDRDRLAVALVAVHALGTEELRALRLDDLDRARGTLAVHRAGGDHRVFLDELTLALTRSWMRRRARRWPHSSNPHLLVSQVTAIDPDDPPMSQFGVRRIFLTIGLTPSQLRIDRILDEARHSADPVRLMRIFGIAANTAIKYLRTAHPDRFVVDPTGP